MRTMVRPLVLSTVCAGSLAAAGCRTQGPQSGSETLDATASTTEISANPQALAIDAGLGEHLWAGEPDAQQQLIKEISAAIEKRYPPGTRPARRDAHPKAHGCVRATFHVEDGLPSDLAQGVFVPGKDYKAWIRFSNAAADPNQPDTHGDGRGMAIKLTGVPGEKLLDSERSAETQDFIMINYPVFFADNPVQYLNVIKKADAGSLLSALIAAGIHDALIMRTLGGLKIANPLSTRFYSMVGYRLGDDAHKQAIKFSAKPCQDVDNTQLPSNPDPNYLKQAMVQTLAVSDACFEFLVQPRTKDWMGPEDSTHEWTESDAPFVKVATITIPAQTFDSEAQMNFCENLSFTPWHALPEHRPLGAVNRARRVIYEAISTLRHQLNGAERQEPTGDETF